MLPLSFLIFVICVFSLRSIWLKAGKFHWFFLKEQAFGLSIWFSGFLFNWFLLQFLLFPFLLTLGLIFFFYFLNIKLRSTDWRPFFYFNIDIKYYKFPQNSCLRGIPQMIHCFHFIHFKILSIFFSSLTHGLITNVSFCFQMFQNFSKMLLVSNLILLL